MKRINYMIKDLKLYEINADESEVYAVSCVDFPAVESNFIFMNKQEQQPLYINLESDEKRMVYGCALRSDFPIYRRHNDEEFYVKFSSKCIEKLSKKFMKNGFQANWTTDHQEIAEGLTVVESWLKVDMEKDKSIALGLDKDLALGSWFIGCSVDNDEVWETIKSGKWNGFSIEAMVVMDEIKLQKQEKIMVEEKLEAIQVDDNFWDKLRSIISNALGKPQESEEVEKTVGEIVDEMEVEGGDKEEEPRVEEMAEEVPQEGEVAPMIDEIAKDVIEEVNEQAPSEEVKIKELEAVIDALKEEINKKDAMIEEMSKNIEKLSKQPSTEPIKVEASKQNAHPSFLDFASGRITFK